MLTNKNSPIYVTNMSDDGSFKMLSKAHKYNTRQSSSSNVFLPSVKTNKLGKCKHEFAGPSIWKQVPNNTKCLYKQNFKKMYHNFLLKQYK